MLLLLMIEMVKKNTVTPVSAGSDEIQISTSKVCKTFRPTCLFTLFPAHVHVRKRRGKNLINQRYNK